MRIMGIDPGMAITGYCILDYFCDNSIYEIANCGSIQTSKKLDNSKRLLEIHNDFACLIEKFKPDIAAVEQIFYFKNAKSIISVSEARGVIIMTLEKFNIPIFEYTPLVVKQTITGYGRAGKDDVRSMVKNFFKEQNFPKLDDTTDAVAIAVCHTIMEEKVKIS